MDTQRIIVPIDFSPASLYAMEYAATLGKVFGNEIVLVYVFHENRFATFFTGADTKDLVLKGIEVKLKEQMERLEEMWPNGKYSYQMLEGRPYQVIEEMTEKDTALVVMGTNGETGVERFIGSTTRRVLSSAHVPVVTVKSKVMNPKFDNIVLPIDLTKTSRQKVDWAVKLAKKFQSVVHVIMEVEKDEFLMNKVKNNLNQVEGILKANNVKYVSKLLDDNSYPDNIGGDTIKYANEVDADLIVIMTQSESAGVSSLFIGNYAEQIVKSSQLKPVISINPKQTTLFEGGVGFY